MFRDGVEIIVVTTCYWLEWAGLCVAAARCFYFSFIHVEFGQLVMISVGVVLKLVIKRWIWIVEGKLEVTCDSLQNGKVVIFKRIMEVMAKLPNCLPEVHNSSSNCDRARDWKSAGIAIFTGRNKSCYLAVTHCAENDITRASVLQLCYSLPLPLFSSAL